ncbi:MAG TPA: hypothetical protein VGQ83_28060 [Polyangia bacterium]|jgi:hypothetical protein
MSDTFLRLVPVDPTFVPSAEAQAAARDYLRAVLPDADTVATRTAAEVQFIDAGGNTEAVFCPLCGAEVDQAWWVQAMDAAFECSFRDLTVALPCCLGSTTLNDLRYEMPAGFARFVLEAANPNVAALAAPAVAVLERLIGRKLRVVWARY